MSVVNKLRDFMVREEFWKGNPDELTPDYPLIEKRVVDSASIFQLVSYIEDEYDIEIPDEDLVPENFETLATMAALAERRGAA